MLVAEAGIEPALPKELHFECSASTNSATQPLQQATYYREAEEACKRAFLKNQQSMLICSSKSGTLFPLK